MLVMSPLWQFEAILQGLPWHTTHDTKDIRLNVSNETIVAIVTILQWLYDTMDILLVAPPSVTHL